MRIKFISKIFWVLEYLFFYPRLKKIYYRINKTQNTDNLTTQNIFDIGAHKGQTVNFFTKVFPKAKIYSFEPNPEAFQVLKKFNSNNISCLNVGFGSKVGETDFFVSKFSETSCLNLPAEDSKWNSFKLKILGLKAAEMYNKIKIKLITVDHFIEQNELLEIFFLKIDVEGSELDVLKGSFNSLSRGKIKYIQLEELRNDLYKSNFLEIDLLLMKVGKRRMYSIRHPVGNFYEHIYG